MIALFFFFFKQKTAYEMRISDWSSDVCSSDLRFNRSSGFFEQTVIPRYHQERLFLADQLVALARRNPTLRFAIKPRVHAGEATLHRTWHHLEPLLRQSAFATGGWPDNLEIVSQPASNLLGMASHCLNVCSTVAAEAIHARIPTVLIGDFGAHDDYGMEYFYGSGLIKNFADIEFPFVLGPRQAWQIGRASCRERVCQYV